jgi:hypothetical protein
VSPKGRIGLANWTPEGFIGQLFRVIGRYLPPPAGLRSPSEWGSETRIVQLFGGDHRRSSAGSTGDGRRSSWPPNTSSWWST